MSGYDDLRAVLVADRPNLPRGARWTCADNPDLWFSEHPEGVEAAKRICRDCPARQRCLAGALARREPWGVWGAELLAAGRVIPRKRGRGRPRKTEEAA